MKSLLLLILIAFCEHQTYAQTKMRPFRLNGIIQADTGTIRLIPTGGKEYGLAREDVYETKIYNGKFAFTGKIAYPSSHLLLLPPSYLSGHFMIDPGVQTIKCNIDSMRVIPYVDNKTMQQERAIFYKTPAALLAYTKQHPDSYVPLWESVRILNNGHSSIVDSIYAALSPTLKRTFTGKVLARRLHTSKVTAIGHAFPDLILLDRANKPVSILRKKRASYTLIDFWFSHCSACIVEFPKLKAVYDAYKPSGFDIIGISIDKRSEIDLWKQTIKEKGLNWNQYIDIGGKVTTNNLAINLFPSNFLLDENGLIVKKNLSPARLNAFLAEKLKK